MTSVVNLPAAGRAPGLGQVLGQVLEQAAGLRLLQLYFV
jgi:hypothetical protein